MGDAERRRTAAFSHLQSHYLFRDCFGRPGKGSDKGKVEALVKLPTFLREYDKQAQICAGDVNAGI